jgi:hypothetical protein
LQSSQSNAVRSSFVKRRAGFYCSGPSGEWLKTAQDDRPAPCAEVAALDAPRDAHAGA